MNKIAMEKLVKVAADLDAAGEFDLANDVEQVIETMVATAAAKKKLDPKAKVRNRGDAIFPASRCKDKQDHFPINSPAQARSALSRASGFSAIPPWYKGTSLESLVKTVQRAVKKKYPKIETTSKSAKPGKG